jgi:hypothetical protein
VARAPGVNGECASKARMVGSHRERLLTVRGVKEAAAAAFQWCVRLRWSPVGSDRADGTSAERGVREQPPIIGKANAGGAHRGGGRTVATVPIPATLVALRSSGLDNK